jgi:hypothetical protein
LKDLLEINEDEKVTDMVFQSEADLFMSEPVPKAEPEKKTRKIEKKLSPEEKKQKAFDNLKKLIVATDEEYEAALMHARNNNIQEASQKIIRDKIASLKKISGLQEYECEKIFFEESKNYDKALEKIKEAISERLMGIISNSLDESASRVLIEEAMNAFNDNLWQKSWDYINTKLRKKQKEFLQSLNINIEPIDARAFINIAAKNAFEEARTELANKEKQKTEETDPEELRRIQEKYRYYNRGPHA